MSSTRPSRLRRARGFSLIELLVSMVIALVVTLAISSVMIRSEGSKRTSTSVNDVNQTALYLSYSLDRTIRSAGSGFAQSGATAFGCVIDASRSGSAVMPLPAALPVPFNNVPLQIRLAPVLIGKGLADGGGQVRGDVLSVLAGTSGASDLPQTVRPGSLLPAGAPTSLRVTNALGYTDGDIVLLSDPTVAAGCMVQQAVGAPVSDQVNFSGGMYSRNAGSVVNVSSFGANTLAMQLGTISATPAQNNPPQMMLLGVDANSVLTSFDLLRTTGSATTTPLADGVIEMRALYGVDGTTPTDNVIDTWVDPTAGSGYSWASLTDGTPNAANKLRRIIAIRVGLILRTNQQERVLDRYNGVYSADTDPATLPSTTVTLFSDLPVAVQQSRTIVGGDNLYRYRTVEFTVPLRNVMYAPAATVPATP